MTTTNYSGIEIEVVQGRDAGCEITDAEWERLEQAQIDALERAFPGAQIEVHTVDGSRSTAVDVTHEDPDDTSAELPDEADVTAVLDAVWEEGSFWRPDSVPLVSECALSTYTRSDAHGVTLLRDEETTIIIDTERLDGLLATLSDECSCEEECDCEEQLWRATDRARVTEVHSHGSRGTEAQCRRLVVEAVEAGLIDLRDAGHLGYELKPADWRVVNTATGEVLPGLPDDRLLERGLQAVPRGGAVAAEEDDGVWTYVYERDVARAKARGERVETVHLEQVR